MQCPIENGHKNTTMIYNTLHKENSGWTPVTAVLERGFWLESGITVKSQRIDLWQSRYYHIQKWSVLVMIYSWNIADIALRNYFFSTCTRYDLDINIRENRMGQSRMDNPETQTTLWKSTERNQAKEISKRKL